MRNIFTYDRASHIIFANPGAAKYYADANEIEPDEQDLIELEVIWYVTIGGNAKVSAMFPPLPVLKSGVYSWGRNATNPDPHVVTEYMVNIINEKYLKSLASPHKNGKGRGYWRS